MKLLMLKSAFSPVKKKTPDILIKGTEVEVDDVSAKVLVQKGYAEEIKDKPAKPLKSETPDDTWTNPELLAYAEEKKIDVKGATVKKDILEAILESTPAA